MSVSYKLWCTVNPWTTQVWTVQFYLQTFFNCKYYCTTWAEAGWICRWGTVNREELSIGRTGYKFYAEFRLHGGLAPLTPWVVWGSPVLCNKIIIDFGIFSTSVCDIWPIFRIIWFNFQIFHGFLNILFIPNIMPCDLTTYFVWFQSFKINWNLLYRRARDLSWWAYLYTCKEMCIYSFAYDIL